MSAQRANRIDSSLLAIAMVGIVLAIGVYAAVAQARFRDGLLPELTAAAQSVGRSSAGLVARALDAGVPPDKLAGMDAVLAETLRSHPELAGMAFDIGSVHVTRGMIPPPPFRTQTAIMQRGRIAGAVILGVDPHTIDRALRELAIDFAALLVVALFLAAEFFRIAVGTSVGQALTGPTIALERAARGIFDSAGASIDPRIGAVLDRVARLRAELADRIRTRSRFGRARVAQAIAALRSVQARFTFAPDMTPPDAGLRAIRAPLFLFMLAEAMTRPFLPLIAARLPRPDWANAALASSATLSAFLLVVALSQPFVGPWSRRVGRRRAFIVGALIGAGAFVGAALAPSFAVMLGMRVIGGLGYGIVFAAAQGYVLDRAPPNERAAGLALFVAAIMVAELCGPSIGGVLADRAGAAVAFLVCAGIAALGALAARAQITPHPGDPRAERFRLRDLVALLAVPRLAALLFAAAVPQKIALTGLAFFLLPIGLATLGERPATAGIFLMLYAVVMVALTSPAAAFAQRLGQRRSFVAVGLACSAFAGFVPLMLPSVIGLGAMAVLLGLGGAIGIASQSALVSEEAPHGPGAPDEARVYGVFRLVERLGNAFGPPIAAAVLVRFGFAVAAAAIGGLLCAALVWFVAVNARGDRRIRRGLVTATMLALVACGTLGVGRRPFVIYMITYRGPTAVERGFKDELAREHVPVTYIERNVHLDARNVRPLLAEIRRLQPDLVYTWGTPVTLATVGTYKKRAPNAITDIPVVFTMVAEPVAVKIVPTLASSGRNVTGVFHVAPLEEQLRAMRAYAPFTTIGALYTASAKNSVAVIANLRALGAREGFHTTALAFAADAGGRPTRVGLEQRVAALRRSGAQWLYLPPDSFLGESLKPILLAAAREGLPTFGTTQQMTDAGALAGVIAPYYGVGELTAVQARRILIDHRAPADVPVATLQRFTYAVSMRLARRLDRFPPLELFRYIEFSKR